MLHEDKIILYEYLDAIAETIDFLRTFWKPQKLSKAQGGGYRIKIESKSFIRYSKLPMTSHRLGSICQNYPELVCKKANLKKIRWRGKSLVKKTNAFLYIHY